MKAAILYLTRKQDISFLIRSLHLLDEFFINKYQYPILILEDNLENSDKEKILLSLDHTNIKNLIQFQNISFQLPYSLSTNLELYNPSLDGFKMGYRSMCQFFSGEIFKNKILEDYDWVWRLDSDSFILNHISYDPFQYMEDNNKVYAYISEYVQDQPYVVDGLFETTKNFIDKQNLKPNPILKNSIQHGWNCEMFYTNFEIMNMKFFKTSGYMDYYEFLNLTNNIFYKRWGDAPIRWLGVNMFAKENEIFCINDIAYQHQHWIKNI